MVFPATRTSEYHIAIIPATYTGTVKNNSQVPYSIARKNDMRLAVNVYSMYRILFLSWQAADSNRLFYAGYEPVVAPDCDLPGEPGREKEWLRLQLRPGSGRANRT